MNIVGILLLLFVIIVVVVNINDDKNEITSIFDKFKGNYDDKFNEKLKKKHKSLTKKYGELEFKNGAIFKKGCKYINEKVSKINDLDTETKDQIKLVKDNIKNLEPLDLLIIIGYKTDYTFSPCYLDNKGDVGLIGFTEEMAKELETTQNKIVDMSFEEQSNLILEYVTLKDLNSRDDKLDLLLPNVVSIEETFDKSKFN